MGSQELSADLIRELVQYRRILNNIPAEIGVFDPEGRFLFNTQSGIHDPSIREWVLGKTHHDFCRKRNYPMEIANRRQSAIDQCVREKAPVLFEEIWTTRNGERRVYARTFSPVLDDDKNVTELPFAMKGLRGLLDRSLKALRAFCWIANFSGTKPYETVAV